MWLLASVIVDDLADETALCRQFAPRIRLYGLRHLRNEDDAADLVQEVLLVLLEAVRAGKLREPQRVASFVLGTCRLVVLDRRRRERRRVGLLDRFGEVLAPEAAGGPTTDVDRLRDCLQALSPRERSVVVLSFYDERAADEIGARLGMTAGHVRVVRHRAVQRLQECMGDNA
jgi:RNA polymerase sigma-70 factor (ECF subfamily)